MRFRRVCRTFAVALCSAALFVGNIQGDELSDALKTLRNVGPNAAGHREAQAAWKIAAAADAARLPELLAALDGASPLSANWIRAAIEQAGTRIAADDKATAAVLEKFILDTSHAPHGRRLAFDLLVRLDASAQQRLMSGFLNDPSTELRRDAVALLIGSAALSAETADAKAFYQQAFAAARDIDQIKQLTETLEKLGEKVDLPTHYGFITTWRLIGPFDNMGEKGFHVAYPPETELKADAKYAGKDGKQVGWIEHTTADAHGVVDLNAALGKNKGAAAYAWAEFRAAEARAVDIRVGCINAVKVWVNGKLIDSREVYHSGSEIDQYVAQAELKAGVNQILVKVCENEQTESWAQDWKFQLRVCDRVGTAVLSADRAAGR